MPAARPPSGHENRDHKASGVIRWVTPTDRGGFHTVTVPAGTFSNCVRVDLTYLDGGVTVTVDRTWFARNVGIVKDQWFGSSPDTLQLTAFSLVP